MIPKSCTLSIVLLNYNRQDETRYTISALLDMTRGCQDIEIIAVDNNSTDGTAEYLASTEGIVPVLLSSNGGIAGYNEGFAKARGQYILVLDDDSCPANLAVLEKVQDRMAHDPRIGILACHIETPAGEPQWKWHLPPSGMSGPSPFFIGCGFCIRRDLFEKIGWYPGDFFLYQNEIDVSFKVYQQGYSIVYDAGCRVIHRGVLSKRPGWRCVYYPTRNSIWIIRRYYRYPVAFYLLFSRSIIGLGRALYLGQPKAYLLAMRDAFAKKIAPSPLSKEITEKARPFWRQNSIFHHIIKKA